MLRVSKVFISPVLQHSITKQLTIPVIQFYPRLFSDVPSYENKRTLIEPLYLFRYLDRENYTHLNDLVDHWVEKYSDEIEPTPKPITTYLEQFKPPPARVIDHKIQKPFNVKSYFENLKSDVLGRNLLYSHQIQSTQTLLFNRLKNFPTDLACVTDIQFGGKGRNDHIWTSPYGCLMFSFKTTFGKATDLCFMQYLISIALIRAVKSIPEYSGLDIGIKWPNDIYLNGKTKIGGIICQSVYVNKKFNVISGVGINVSNSFPTTCLDDEASHQLHKFVDVGRSHLLAAFFNEFSVIFQIFRHSGFEVFHDEYISYWLHSDEEMTVQELDGTKIKVHINDINAKGFLTAKDENGNILDLYPDSTSVNLMDRLIIKRE